MRILCLQHSTLGGETHLPVWARRRGFEWSSIVVPETAVLPRPADVECLVVMGGPMSAWEDDTHRWLRNEKRLIGALIEAGKPVLGVCLGAQMLAGLLGARTYRGPMQEIGWFPVRATSVARGHPVGAMFPPEFETFLWHGDSFDLPTGAVHLARSDVFEHQAFAWDRVLALQFHLEVRLDWVRRITKRDAGELHASRSVQPIEAILGKPGSVYRANNALLDAVLDRWIPF